MDKYRFNPNVRTTVHIIVLQLGLTLLSIVIFGWAIQYAEVDTLKSITEHVHNVVTGASTSPESLPASIDAVRNRTYSYVFVGLVLLNLLFGFLIAYFALKPARQTLSFQKRFIGNVAHEIRTPLAIIKTSTEVTLLDPSLPASVRETMQQTILELNRISETINNLLSFDSLTRPKSMKFEEVDLSEVVNIVVSRHQDLAKSRDTELSSIIMTHGLVHGNATALDQVVTNLVKNAINYTPAHKDGKVVVEVSRAATGGVAISVSDTGIGIAQKDLYHIFEPFYRADTSRARGVGTGAAGIGLAIVNEIVRLHHGAITVRSALNHGTTVKVTLPASANAGEQTPLMSPSGSPHEATLDFS